MITDMMIEAMTTEIKENLKRSCRQAAEGALDAVAAETVTQGIEQALAAAGRAGFKTYLESKEEPQDIILKDGQTYRFKQFTNKDFTSLWGAMRVSRKLFQNAADTQSCCPMDEAWGMAGEPLTIEVREALGFACAHMPPEEAAQLLKKSALFHVDPTGIKRALVRMEETVAPIREQLDACIRQAETAPQDTQALVVSMDGANVLLNEPGKKKGRPAERPSANTDEEQPTSYKNAMVGTVSFYGYVKEEGKCPERLATRYVAQMPEECAPTFKAKFEAELDAAEAQCASQVAKVVLCDGARNIWNYIDHNARFDDYDKLVDYWHALEHLSWAAEALFGKASPEGAAWYAKHRKRLKESERGAQGVIDSIDYYAKTRKLSPGRRNKLNTQRTFFVRNKHHMAYAAFRARGLPIGSGPVEAACKSLVKVRMCRSGMRWSRAGGQRILDLRTYVKSKRWDAFWKLYKQATGAVSAVA
jgi:hypothetical protein